MVDRIASPGMTSGSPPLTAALEDLGDRAAQRVLVTGLVVPLHVPDRSIRTDHERERDANPPAVLRKDHRAAGIECHRIRDPELGDHVAEVRAILVIATAVCEIVGCYLPYLWLRKEKSAWLLAPAALSLALFAYLLTLHPQATGRTYASYGGVYVAMAVLWIWLVGGQLPDKWDLIGASIAIVGMAIIAFGPRNP